MRGISAELNKVRILDQLFLFCELFSRKDQYTLQFKEILCCSQITQIRTKSHLFLYQIHETECSLENLNIMFLTNFSSFIFLLCTIGNEFFLMNLELKLSWRPGAVLSMVDKSNSFIKFSEKKN